MRTGVGRALIQDLVDTVKVGDVARINVTVNHHALSFYEAVGFVADGAVRTRFGTAPRMRLEVV